MLPPGPKIKLIPFGSATLNISYNYLALGYWPKHNMFKHLNIIIIFKYNFMFNNNANVHKIIIKI